MERTEGLTLTAVVDRFSESEAVLNELQSKLQKIVLAEQGATRSSESLDEASSHLTQLTAALVEVVSVVRDAQLSVSDAARTAASFLESTDLTRMDERLQEMDSKINEIHGSISAQGREVVAAVSQLRDVLGNEMRQLSTGVQRNSQQIAAVEAQVEDSGRLSSKALTELEQVKAVLPGRMQKRL